VLPTQPSAHEQLRERTDQTSSLSDVVESIVGSLAVAVPV
jgi:hypothetical protein